MNVRGVMVGAAHPGHLSDDYWQFFLHRKGKLEELRKLSTSEKNGERGGLQGEGGRTNC